MTGKVSHAEARRRRERIGEALAILHDVDVPREQMNDRSALVLLALADLASGAAWSQATDPLRGVTQLMTFIAENYRDEPYAPNSRETIRRYTLHQFVQAGLVLYNPDKPDRPVNSPKAAYRLSPAFLAAVRAHKAPEWARELAKFRAAAPSLAARYAQPRKMTRVPLRLPSGEEFTLSPGGQSPVVRAVVEQFCPRFTPGALPLYVGDTEEKWAYIAKDRFASVGVVLDEHGKMPDVAIYWDEKNWLVLVEAVTSHGPMSPKRAAELRTLFEGCSAWPVFVTALSDLATFTRYASEIAWETEVWIVEDPDHMIHFNGERFLGPYPAR
jgi:adenine-specific DNA-methyltransferase